MIELKQELGQQHVATLKAELEGLEGAQFDRCYMGHQLVAHMKMLDTLKVFKEHASPELAQVIQAGIDTTADHLKHARAMMKDFDKPAAETVRRPATEEQKKTSNE